MSQDVAVLYFVRNRHVWHNERIMKDYFKNIGFHFRFLMRFTPFLSISLLLIIIALSIVPFYIQSTQGSIIDSIISFIKDPTGAGIGAGSGNVSILGIVIPSVICSLILLYALLTLGNNALQTLRGLTAHISKKKFEMYFEFSLLKKFLSLDAGRYEDPDFKLLCEKGVDMGNHWSLSRTADIFYRDMLPSFITFCIAMIVVGRFNLWIPFIIVIMQIPYVFLTYVFNKKNYNLWDKNGGHDQRMYFMLRNQIRGKVSRTELKLYQAENYFLRKIKDVYDAFFGKIHDNEKKRLVFGFMDDILKASGYIIVFAILVEGALSGVITVGYVTFLISSIFSASMAAQRLMNSSNDSITFSRFATSTRAFMNTKPLLTTMHTKEFDHLKDYSEDHIPKSGMKPSIPQFELPQGIEILFEDVRFHYPKESEEDRHDIFSKLNLTLKSGQKIGLIGNNGVGKSTLIKLLCRVYDPVEGAIYANGINIRHIPSEIWQRYISVLMQSYTEYELTVREAIAVSQDPENRDDDRVKESAEKSQAMEFISKYEHGLDAQLGKDFGGVTPSGGQKQKLALARTFYRKAPIVILDEPTAAIDAESEIEIFKELEKLPSTVTAIFISHDMGTIMRADRIILLKDGGVEEDGTHAELMKKRNGRYRKMYEGQVKAMGV